MWKSRHARGIVAVGLLVSFVCAAGLCAESSARPLDDELLRIVPAESLFCMRVNNFEYTVRMIDQFLAGSSSMPMAQMDIPTKSNIAFAGNAGNGRMVVDIAVPKEHLMETMAAALVMQQQMMKLQQKKVMMQQKQPGSPRSRGIEDISPEEMMWVKCNNPDCKSEYEMGKQAYFKYVEEHIDPMAMVAPPVVCEECGKESVFRAEKCQNADCAIVFFRGSVPNDFADRCPACGNSNTEEQRKRRRAGGLRR